MTPPLPMFPLGTVVFPHGGLPLRIFEPRYRRLLSDCRAGEGRFGVVLIERGSEVGGGDQRSAIGCRVAIVQAEELAGGEWAVLAIGEERIVVTAWAVDDPYPQAEVSESPDPPWDAEADRAMQAAEPLVRRSLALAAELGEPAAPFGMPLAVDPSVAAWQLANVAPLGPLDRQRLLVAESAPQRLRLLATMASDACEMLALRLAGG